jgi:two-component system sensor histidine kinase ArlS
MKIKFRITALFTLLVSAILLLLSFSVYYFSSLQRYEAFHKRLKGRATNNAQIFSLFGDTSNRVLARIDSGAAGTFYRKSIAIYDKDDKPLYEFTAKDEPQVSVNHDQLEKARSLKEYHFTTLDKKDAIAYYSYNKGNAIIIVASAYDQDGWDHLKELRDILFISLVIGIGIALLTGYLFSTALVKPIIQIIHEVKDISSQNLSHRIQAGKGQDELHQLANTFNELLNRLQESFAIQRRFISNASHELSTPLTSISSQLEVTLHKDRNIEEYRQVMQSILEDVQQLQRLTRILLEIAKTGSQGGIELNEVRIDEVLFKIMSDVKKISPAYQVELHFGEVPDDEKDILVFGNGDLLYSALKNIVENGCKFSPDHFSWVELVFERDDLFISVKNKGDVIAEEEIDHIFQPFYRTPAATMTRGFGLGLALAKRIIAIHKGEITVHSDIVTGTVFNIRLPSIKKFAL